jgi:ribonucleoside-diphosphate reductase alpha chain
MQATWQKYVDNAVSKTINMPHDSTVDDVLNAYVIAWEMGCKGITIYRDRSRSFQILEES